MFSMWSRLEKRKGLKSWCLMSWLQIKKIVLKSCLLLFYVITNHFSIRLWPEMKSGFYFIFIFLANMNNFYFKDYKVNKQIHLSIGLSSNYTTKPVLSATSLRQQWMFFSLYLVKSGFYTTIMDNKLGGWTKKFQSTSWSLTCTKKRSWLLFGGLVWCHSDPLQLNPSKTNTSEKYAQQTDERHRKLQHLQPILVKRMHPVLLNKNIRQQITQPMLQNLNKFSQEVLQHSPY